MPSQHVSFRGRRTTFAFQDAIACTDAESDGPSKMPQPCAQAYSAPERFTPRSRTGCPRESTSRVPCTCTVGAPAGGGGGGWGGGGGGEVPPLVVEARQLASVLNVSNTTRRMVTARMWLLLPGSEPTRSQAVVSARASDRTRNATTRCTAPTTSANHAISASTVVTVSRGYTTAAAASARVRNPPSTLQPGAAPIAFWARASRNCTMLAISIHSDTDITMYASDRLG